MNAPKWLNWCHFWYICNGQRRGSSLSLMFIFKVLWSCRTWQRNQWVYDFIQLFLFLLLNVHQPPSLVNKALLELSPLLVLLFRTPYTERLNTTVAINVLCAHQMALELPTGWISVWTPSWLFMLFSPCSVTAAGQRQHWSQPWTKRGPPPWLRIHQHLFWCEGGGSTTWRHQWPTIGRTGDTGVWITCDAPPAIKNDIVPASYTALHVHPQLTDGQR